MYVYIKSQYAETKPQAADQKAAKAKASRKRIKNEPDAGI